MAVSTALLQLFDPFDGLNDDQLSRVAELASIERLPKGTFITKRGKEIESINYLVAGNVDLVDGNFESESIDSNSERRVFPLVASSPSAVSAMAKTEVEILVVDKEAHEAAQVWKEEGGLEVPQPISDVNEEGEDWMVCLLESPLFSQVPPEQIQKLFTCFEAIEVESGEDVLKEGASGDYFYVIESGQAEVHNRFSGSIATLKAGQFFGEEALVGETIRNASVTMRTPGVVMRLNKDDFKALLFAPLIRYVNGEEVAKQTEMGIKYRIIDVRLGLEYRKLHVENADNIPLSVLRDKISELDHDFIYVVTDDGGKRSEVATHLLCQAGFNTYILQNAYQQYPLDKLA